MAERVWVAQVLISPATEAKIRAKHQIEPDEVRQEVQCRGGLLFTWNDHPERGRRLMIQAQIRGRGVLIVLYPVGDDVYHLGSAYFPGNGGHHG